MADPLIDEATGSPEGSSGAAAAPAVAPGSSPLSEPVAGDNPPRSPGSPGSPAAGSAPSGVRGSAPSEGIIPRVIEEEMKEAYLNYAMSVIVGRALPDVRDGLKPVHRRILYSMYEMGLFHNKPFKKCARIVGDCLGKFHPHGDTAVYDALVRMAQEFSLRYPLIKGQGNFGSVDGDSAAAMRYTEAKLTKLAGEILQDLEKDTVDFQPNFDGSLKEPLVLPTKLPNLLVNGSSGIAVGMATTVPPHNLREVCDAAIALIENPELSVEELMKIVPGPDFPTGGEVLCGAGLQFAYARGKGRVTIKAIAALDERRIVITEIPYQVNKAELIQQIAALVRDKRVQGIRDLNDESDREGIRIVIELKEGADASAILNQLYQYSNLKVTFGIQMLALVNRQPRLIGLRELLQHHIEYRREVILRRTRFELGQAQERRHIVQGLLTALENIDAIVSGIRNSRSVDDAKEFLIVSYSFTELQAKAILEMRLQKLASLEREKLHGEHQELLRMIALYEEILGSDSKVRGLIREELEQLKQEFGEARRSRLVQAAGEEEEFDLEDLVEKDTVVVTMTHAGYIKRLPLGTYRLQRRGGKGVIATGTKEEDFVERMHVASTHDYLLCFTDQGQLYWLKVYQIPEAGRQARGRHFANVLELQPGERITALVPVPNFTAGYLFMATRKGIVKKTELMEFSNPRRGGIRAVTLEEDDSLVGVKYTDGTHEIILATRGGYANRFREKDVRPMGRGARGVRGITLEEGDYVIGMLAAVEGLNILTLTEKGYGKRTPVSEYRICRRGGKGVTNIKITERNGPVKSIMLANGGGEVMLISRQGVAIRIKCSDISVTGRATQGVRVMKLEEGDQLAAAAKVVSDGEIEGEENGGEIAGRTPGGSSEEISYPVEKNSDHIEKPEEPNPGEPNPEEPKPERANSEETGREEVQSTADESATDETTENPGGQPEGHPGDLSWRKHGGGPGDEAGERP